jgi:hypothetical protein
MTARKTYLPVLLYGFFLAVYSVWSYALTAPNLILSSWPPYWQFQTYMWQTFFNNRVLLTQSYALVLTLLWLALGYLAWQWRNKETWEWRQVIGLTLVLVFPLLFANTALSYDIFNYLFNAKMLLVYHTNPHIHVALEFADDPWVRFMHNTHTAAPYAYGWTALSLIPSVLGAGRFTLTWMLFRGWSLISLLLLIAAWRTWMPRPPQYWWLVVLNPLMLLEIIATSHNDLWMMAPAVASLGLVSRKANFKSLTLSLALLVCSISIKWATLVLLPLWLWLAWCSLAQRPLLPPATTALIASLLLFVPLLTGRSQQFHPWYATWILVWIPLIWDAKSKWQRLWALWILSLSVASLYRYLPYLWYGEFSPPVLPLQKAITFLGAATLTLAAWYAQRSALSNK